MINFLQVKFNLFLKMPSLAIQFVEIGKNSNLCYIRVIATQQQRSYLCHPIFQRHLL